MSGIIRIIRMGMKGNVFTSLRPFDLFLGYLALENFLDAVTMVKVDINDDTFS